MHPDLREYQKDGVKWLLTKDRAVLGDEPGVGKTPQAIFAALRKDDWPAGQEYLFLVICPASITKKWAREINEKWHGHGSAQIVGTKDEITPWKLFTIMSYDVARRRIALDALPAFKILILDEAHALKNLRAKRTRAILGEYAKRCSFVWALTGTVMPNNIVDCYSIFNFCMRGKLGKYKDFINRYSHVRMTPWGPKAYGGKNLSELSSLLAPFFLRRTIDEIGDELPDFSESEIELESTPAAKQIFKVLDQEKAAIKKALADGKIPRGSKLSTYRHDLGVEKAKAAASYIGETYIEADIPVVIFSVHPEVAWRVSDFLRNEFPAEGAVLTGDDDVTVRDAKAQLFQEGKLKYLSATIGSMAEGHDLFAAANCVFVEHPWTPAQLRQAMGRIRRIGQKNFCHYDHLLMGSLDKMILQNVRAKQRVIDCVLDGGEEEPREEIVWE